MQTNKPGRSPNPVREVMGTENFAFNRTSNEGTGGRPQIPPSHPGLAKIQHPKPNAGVSHSPRPDTQAPPLAAQVPPTPQQPLDAGHQMPYAEKNPEYLSVDLPSGFTFYPFKSLSLRSLQGLHISKISRAHKEQRIRYLVEGISSTLEPGVSAFDLIPADFYYLMYWQRVSSFPKSPLLIDAYCTDAEHNIKVIEGIRDAEGEFVKDDEGKILKLDRETLRIDATVNSTTLDVKNLELPELDKFAELDEKYNLGYETMRDVVESIEHFEEKGEEEGGDFMWLASLASFLKPGPGRKTLKERCKIVEAMDPDEIELLQEYSEIISDFGVAESANLKCKECGASTRVNISFDALTFLPKRG